MAQRIGFFHDIEDKQYWKDGLWAALRSFDVREFEDHPINFVWTGSGGKHLQRTYSGKVVWLYAGGAFEPRNVDVVVVEDRYSQRRFKERGVETSIAFGVNTDLFKPLHPEKKWKVIFPGAFARWKRHDLLVRWVEESGIDPSKVLVVGHKQKVETECYKICEEAGFEVRDLVTPDKLAELYNQSEECWIPSETMGGSQRTLLEARACGLKTRVALDNQRLWEMEREPIPSHHRYAKKLNEICESLL